MSAYSSPEKFQKRAVQFGFPEEVTPVVCFLEASGRRFGKVSLAPTKAHWQFTFNCVSGVEFLDPQDVHMHTKSHSLFSDTSTGHLVAV